MYVAGSSGCSAGVAVTGFAPGAEDVLSPGAQAAAVRSAVEVIIRHLNRLRMSLNQVQISYRPRGRYRRAGALISSTVLQFGSVGAKSKLMGPLETKIRSKIEAAFQPITHFELVNESHSHSVPKNSETHFKLVLVSPLFDGLSRIARQRRVYEVLAEEMSGGVHALTQRLLAPAEWTPEAVATFESPNCHGGSKSK